MTLGHSFGKTVREAAFVSPEWHLKSSVSSSLSNFDSEKEETVRLTVSFSASSREYLFLLR